MLWLYRLVFLPVLLIAAPYYLLRMRKRGGYAAHFGHRFGGHPVLSPSRAGAPRLWVQAVSVGEMLAIGPILKALHADGVEIYLTTTTSTGFELAKKNYGALTAGIGYFPVDFWLCSARAWRRIAPDVAIVVEGERWPEHLYQAQRRGVPVLCINARLSDRSFARMKSFRPAARLMTEGITRLLPCAAQDEARFAELGVPRARMAVTGNIKLDVQITPLGEAEKSQLRRELGLPDLPVVLGSSTWPGEEAALLQAWEAANRSGLRCALLLVPRHAERRGEIEALLKERVRYHFRSRGAAGGEVDVAVGDTTGELRKFTQLAAVVFVGKSLPPHTEGQTPVEAAALGKPILLGPGMSNFRAIVSDLKARGAVREVTDPAALVAGVVDLLRDVDQRSTLSSAAAQWQRDNGGAVERTLVEIRRVLAAVKK